MAIEIRVPTLGESVTEASIGQWFKKVGETVKADEPLVELETDKVTLEVPAPADGVITEIVAEEGETVNVDALLASFTPVSAGVSAPAASERRHLRSVRKLRPHRVDWSMLWFQVVVSLLLRPK